MKFLFVVVIVALVAAAQGAGLTAEQSAKLREYYKVCLESSHVSKDLVEKARSGDFADDAHLDDFFTCMFKRANFIDDEGHLKPDVIKSKVPAGVSDEDVKKLLTTCAKAQNGPKSKVATNAYKCYLAETPVKVQLIETA